MTLVSRSCSSTQASQHGASDAHVTSLREGEEGGLDGAGLLPLKRQMGEGFPRFAFHRRQLGSEGCQSLKEPHSP